MDRWDWAIVHGVSKSDTVHGVAKSGIQLSDFHHKNTPSSLKPHHSSERVMWHLWLNKVGSRLQILCQSHRQVEAPRVSGEVKGTVLAAGAYHLDWAGQARYCNQRGREAGDKLGQGSGPIHEDKLSQGRVKNRMGGGSQ